MQIYHKKSYESTMNTKYSREIKKLRPMGTYTHTRGGIKCLVSLQVQLFKTE